VSDTKEAKARGGGGGVPVNAMQCVVPAAIRRMGMPVNGATNVSELFGITSPVPSSKKKRVRHAPAPILSLASW
jgi:hypothetical protein